MTFKWSSEACISLIDNYKQHPCLWNSKDIKYKCREAKNDAWSNICNNINCEKKEEAKRKMRNLQAQFYRERKKYKSMKKSGAGASVISKWFAYDSLLFLRDKNKVRPCQDGGAGNDADSSDDNDIDMDDSLSEVTEIEAIASENPQENAEDRESQENQNQRIQVKEKVSLEPEGTKTDIFINQPKKRKVKSNDDQVQEAYEVMKNLQNKQKRDRFSVFGEHVANKLRLLDNIHAQNMVEHLISNLLWEASVGKYDQPSFNQYYSTPLTFHSNSSGSAVSMVSPSSVHTPIHSPGYSNESSLSVPTACSTVETPRPNIGSIIEEAWINSS